MGQQPVGPSTIEGGPGEQMAKGAELDAVIRQKLARLGCDF